MATINKIDLNGDTYDIESSGLVTTQPTNPTEGATYYDTVNDVVRVYDGTNWNPISGGGGGGSGDVVGPNSSTNGHLAVFDGPTGKIIKDGGAVPTVPTNVSDFNNDAGYITGINSTDVTTALGYTPYNSTNPAGYITSSDIPTDVSDFNNDAGYLTSSTGVTSVNGNHGAVTVSEYTAGTGIEIRNGNDYSALKGPCPDGYHVPTLSEFSDLVSEFLSLGLGEGTFHTYYKVPMAGFAGGDSGYSFRDTGTQAKLVLATAESADRTYYAYVTTSDVDADYNLYKGYYGYSIRPFKDEPAIPDSNWTVLYQGTGDAGIYHNATEGLISLSTDGTNWLTVADKNLGATTVFNTGDTLSEANCGKFYQWGNNYGFPGVASDITGVVTSSTKVDASSYGPGEYSSSTFIITGADWSSVTNNNLRGGVTGVVTFHNAITNTGVLSVNGQTGDVTVNEPTVVSGDSGVTYTIKVSNSDPASGTASNIITLVP